MQSTKSRILEELRTLRAKLAFEKIELLAPAILLSTAQEEVPLLRGLQAHAKWNGFKNKRNETYLDLKGQHRFVMFKTNVFSIGPSQFAKLLVDLLDFVHTRLAQE